MTELLFMSSESLLKALPLGNVSGDSASRIGIPGMVAQRKLDREIGMQPVIMRRQLFIFDHTVPLQDLQIVCAERVGNLPWKDFMVRMADNLFGPEMKQLLKAAVGK